MLFSSTNLEKNNLLNLATDILKENYSRHFIGDKLFVADRAMGFFDDEKFTRVFKEIAKAPIYQGMAWRIHTLVWAVKSVMHLQGDLVECGVFRGFKSDFLCRYFEIDSLNKKFWLFDTFEGMCEKYSDGSPIDKAEHNKPQLYEFVQERFSNYQNVNICKGVVPDIFDVTVPERVIFLHLDMNSYLAETGALEILWPKMPIGAVVILDDYGFYEFKAQKENEDKWFEERGQFVLELPSGQGLVVKR